VIRLSLIVCAVVAMSATVSSALAQNPGGGLGTGGNNFFGVVGGVAIDANGAISPDVARLDQQTLSRLIETIQKNRGDQTAGIGTRVISMNRLERLLRDSAADKTEIPPDAAFLGGLQRIESIVVDTANNDLLIVGQGDDWTVNQFGAIVGANNGQPVVQLQDLIVAMRYVDAANSGAGISVSIDPTPEGAQLFQTASASGNFDPALVPALEEAMGPQQISLTGVPPTSRFAQVLANADFKMKRISMGLEAAPIDNFPSLLEMLKRRDATFGTMSPRFWMECNYEPVAKSEDGTVWKISGPGVKTLTDEQYFSRDGERKAANKKNVFAEKWAAMMTERYEELATAEPAFAELRNIMDLSVVAAIIRKHDLMGAANTELPCILGQMASLEIPEYTAPKTVPSQCSFIRATSAWIVTASGGVLLDSWGVASNVEINNSLTRDSLGKVEFQDKRIWTSIIN
jgi:hypothetical protein